MKNLIIKFCADIYSPMDYNTDKDIWILAVDIPNVKKYDKVFELHCKNTIDGKYGDKVKGKTISNLLNKVDRNKIILGHKNDKFKGCEIYPWNKIINKYGSYLTNSIVLMLLYAFEKGHTDIEIYGLNLSTSREKEIERRCAEYWIGYLRGKGCKILVKNEIIQQLTCNFIYGLEDEYIQKALIIINNKIKKLEKLAEYNYSNKHYGDCDRLMYKITALKELMDEI